MIIHQLELRRGGHLPFTKAVSPISLPVLGASVTNLNEPARALATSTIKRGLGASSIPFGPL